MSNREETVLDGTPWTLAVDDEARELHIEHAESGDAYVFDAEGNLRVPGDGDVGDLHEVRDALASALEEPPGTAQTADEGACSVACDEETGELKLRSEEGISLEAPTIELESSRTLSLRSRDAVAVEGNSEVSLTANGEVSLDAGLIEAMASGPMTLQGALINLN
ncbi:MAG: hypothetical protein V5A13_02665 [Haloarculaceae archaeon]